METISSISYCFGYHTKNTSKNPTEFNVLNALGYVPVVGLGTAAVRAYGVANGSTTTAGKVALVVRAIFEALGVGLIFLIPDLIVTARRAIHQCRESCNPSKIQK